MSIDELTAAHADHDLEAFASLRGAERDAAIMGVEREIRQLSARRAAMIGIVAASGSYVDDAHHTPQGWVQAVMNTSRSTALTLVRTAHVLRDVGSLADAVAAGRVGDDQLRELSKVWSNPRCRARLPEHGHVLVEPAATMVFDDFTRVVTRWTAHADPDGAHRDHETSRANRHARIHQQGHGGILHAEGDAVAVEEMAAILRAHAESEFLEDCEARRVQHGDKADQHPLRRSHRQRCFDALQEIFRKAARTSVSGVAAPTVNIMTTEADLANAINGYFGRAPEPKHDRQRISETDAGAPVDPDDLAIAAILGQVRRVIVADDNRVIDLGRKRRLFTGAAREAILLAGRRCNRPGCHHPAANAQIDHLEGWACNGCTTALNGGPSCPLHNRGKHRLGFTVTHDRTGWHHYRPDGSEICPRAT